MILVVWTWKLYVKNTFKALKTTTILAWYRSWTSTPVPRRAAVKGQGSGIRSGGLVVTDSSDVGSLHERGEVFKAALLLFLLPSLSPSDPSFRNRRCSCVSSSVSRWEMAALRTLRKLCQHTQHQVCKLHTSASRWVSSAHLLRSERL